MAKIFLTTDNTNTQFAFKVQNITRVEKSNSNVRVGLHNEINRLTYNTSEEAQQVYDKIVKMMLEEQ